MDQFGSIPRKLIVLCDEVEEIGEEDEDGEEAGGDEEDGNEEAGIEGEGVDGAGQLRPSGAPLAASSVGGFLERMWAYRSIKKYMTIKDVQAEGPQEVANVETQIRSLALKVCKNFITCILSVLHI